MLVGTRVKRVEDVRLLRGAGRFVDDVVLPGMLHACFVRSPYPHARIADIDISGALAVPGVVAVYTGEDIAGLVSPMISSFTVPGLKKVTFAAMARDKVRFVGDLVAVVVAESRYVAEDGAEAVVVDYDPLPAVASIEGALDPGSPPIFEDLADNIVLETAKVFGDIDAAFASADHVVRRTFVQQRQSPSPMETRGGVAAYTPATSELSLHGSVQGVHMRRVGISRAMHKPLQLIRVTAADVGGSFGQKSSLNISREELSICAASTLLGRPVKWIEDRRENLLAGGQAREETVEAELALKSDGTILGLRVGLTVDSGAYPMNELYIAAWMVGKIWETLPSDYRINSFAMTSRVVATNKATYVAYRAPWAVETWVRERLFDEAAQLLGIDPVEFRRRNLVGLDEQPYTSANGALLEGVTTVATLNRATERLGYTAARELQRQARAEGRYVGVGVASHTEVNGFAGLTERATVRVELDGTVSVLTAQVPHGQSHSTTLAQIAADELSVPFEQVRVVYGDTNRVPFKVLGTGGSLAATMATGSVQTAAREVSDQIRRVAAHLREADPADVELVDGWVRIRGVPDSATSLAEIAATTYMSPRLIPPGMDPALEATSTFAWPGARWTVGTHGCLVEVDPRTGQVEIKRYVAVVDCGSLINPAIVEGQVRGGIAQGIAGVLYEHANYDREGQYLPATFMDYLMPTASEIPDIEVECLPAPEGELKPLGIGEAGAIVAPAAVSNAIADALMPVGVSVTRLYMPPSAITELLATG
jgi:aerobic carbon-monoxide dehydrogenase large subunit